MRQTTSPCKAASVTCEQVHRVGLASDLVDVASALPAITFHFGHSLQQIDLAGHRAVLEGAAGRVEARYDLMVAADGANSTARSLLQVQCM